MNSNKLFTSDFSTQAKKEHNNTIYAGNEISGNHAGNQNENLKNRRDFLKLGGILCLVLLMFCFSGCKSDSVSKEKKSYNPFSSKERKLNELEQQISKCYDEADKAQRNGKVHDVRRAYEKVLAIYDENKENKDLKREVEPYCRLGIVQEGFGQYESAENYYRQAMEVDAKSPVPYNCIGYCYLSQHRIDEAIQYFQKAVDLAPMEPKFNNNLGLAYGIRKDYEKAFQCFRRVASEADAYYNMSGIYAMNKCEKEAKAALIRAIELNPSHREAKRMLTAYSEYEQNPEEFEKPLYSGDFPGSSVPYQEVNTANAVGGNAAEAEAEAIPAYTHTYGSIHNKKH